MDFYPVELRIISWMADNHAVAGSNLRAQVAHLRLTERQSTGKGFFLLFEPVPQRLRCDELNDVISAAVSTALSQPRDIVGFSLFIRGGAISSFEGYSFGGEPWPEAPMEDWLALEELVMTEQKAN